MKANQILLHKNWNRFHWNVREKPQQQAKTSMIGKSASWKIGFFEVIRVQIIGLNIYYKSLITLYFRSKLSKLHNSTTSIATPIACKRPQKKTKRSMIHSLLLILCISDLCVLIGLVSLFSLPHIWPLFGKQWVHIAPYLIPISQIALLTSEYATVLISFERYVRIVYVCNLRICRFFNEDNFK